MQSSCDDRKTRLHVGIIMDGNGRWASLRGLPRAAGHRAGVGALRRTIAAAGEAGIGTLTVYAFSADNWKRPPVEVSILMGLLRGYLTSEVDQLAAQGVRLSVIGRRDRLDADIVAGIEAAEAATAAGTRLHVRIAVDYSSRTAMLEAVRRAVDEGPVTRDAFERALSCGTAAADVDLVIRTSGEQRLSDFLLWECAYAELYFTPRLWPDFAAADLHAALAVFHRRDRRFGGCPVGVGASLTPASVELLLSGASCHE